MTAPDLVDITLGGMIYDENNVERRSWILCNKRLPRSEIVFFTQSILVFIIVLVSVACLALSKTCEETTVWVAILSSSVGYMLPSPKL